MDIARTGPESDAGARWERETAEEPVRGVERLGKAIRTTWEGIPGLLTPVPRCGTGAREKRHLRAEVHESSAIDRQMRKRYGIERIAPHHHYRGKPTQDRRPMRRYRRPGTVEHLLA